MTDAEDLLPQHRRQLERDRLRNSQRALRPGKKVRQIVRGAVRHQCIQIITADPARKVGEPGLDFLCLPGTDRQKV